MIFLKWLIIAALMSATTHVVASEDDITQQQLMMAQRLEQAQNELERRQLLEDIITHGGVGGVRRPLSKLLSDDIIDLLSNGGVAIPPN
jgi:hypothetical protein